VESGANPHVILREKTSTNPKRTLRNPPQSSQRKRLRATEKLTSGSKPKKLEQIARTGGIFYTGCQRSKSQPGLKKDGSVVRNLASTLRGIGPFWEKKLTKASITAESTSK